MNNFKKIISILLTLVMVFALTACSDKEKTPVAPGPVQENTKVKIGFVDLNDANAAYSRNFYSAIDNATAILKEKGIETEWIYKYNLPEGEGVTAANIELAEAGCQIVFNNSYGQEPAMLVAAPDYPDVHFVNFTNEASTFDDLENTHNAFVRIFEGRYLTGIAAGMKLNEMIEKEFITPEEAIIGYVGAYPFAEVISGYTAYYLGAKSVCPSVTMKVSFVNSWGDATLEAQAALTLCDQGCVMISQHSDNTTPATTAQQYGVFHTSYNIDMSDVAPEASIIGCRVDWTNYFVHAIECIATGQTLNQDYCTGLVDGDVVLTELNLDIAAPGTFEALEEAAENIKNGKVKVFDTETFTVNGEKVTSCFALDTDGDWVPDSEEAIINGEFKESLFKSAPYFALEVDGITMLN